MPKGALKSNFFGYLLVTQTKIIGISTNAPVLKTDVAQATEGSNPSPSAILFLIPQGIERSPNRERSFFIGNEKGWKRPQTNLFWATNRQQDYVYL
jgi:hypothetical protein